MQRSNGRIFIYKRLRSIPKGVKSLAWLPLIPSAAAYYMLFQAPNILVDDPFFALAYILAAGGLTLLAAMMFFSPEFVANASLFIRNPDRNLTEALCEEYPLNFTCSSCYHTVNIAKPWICGHCRYEHTHWLNGPLFSGCVNTELCRPEVNGKLTDPALKHRALTAFQCPNCADHILINPKLYTELRSHEKPYRGVARFVGDTKQPKIGGLPVASRKSVR